MLLIHSQVALQGCLVTPRCFLMLPETRGFHLGQGAPGYPWPQVHPCSQLQQHSHPPLLGGFAQTFHVSLAGVYNMSRVLFKEKHLEKFILKVTWKECLVANSVREWLGLRLVTVWEILVQLTCAACSTHFRIPFREQHGQELRSSIWRIIIAATQIKIHSIQM